MYGRSSLEAKHSSTGATLLPLSKRDIRFPIRPPRRPTLLLLFALFMSAFFLISLSYPHRLWNSLGPPVVSPDTPFLDVSPVPLHDDDYALWASRAEEIKAEFLSAYHMYEEYAFPHDELKPLTRTAIDNYNGWGVTVVDSLDTMLLMGAQEEYQRALKHVASIDLRKATGPIPFFETTIRYLGGLLSAYALTNDTLLLTKASQLATELLPVFDTPLGIPVFSVDPATAELVPRWGKDTLLAEIGTCQLEFQQLAHYTGRSEYFEAVDKMTELLTTTQDEETGTWGTVWETMEGVQKNDKMAVGGEADSTYEYLLKSYLQTSRQDQRTKTMFIKAINGIINNLLYISPTRKLLYVTDSTRGRREPSHKLEHLSCFLPGAIALGAKYLDHLGDEEERKVWGWAAEGLARTCWMTYVDQASGLGPDEVVFKPWPGDHRRGLWVTHLKAWRRTPESRVPDAVPPGVRDGTPLRGNRKGLEMDYTLRNDQYQLRPETIESLFILFKTTGDPIWRDRAWEIFEAIRKHTKVRGEGEGGGGGSGFSSVRSVNAKKPSQTNAMPSWFLAETLKYMYLVALPSPSTGGKELDLVPLDKWVFNTEAHPFPVFEWSERQKESYFGGKE